MTQNAESIKEKIGKSDYLLKIAWQTTLLTKSKDNWQPGKIYMQHISQTENFFKWRPKDESLIGIMGKKIRTDSSHKNIHGNGSQKYEKMFELILREEFHLINVKGNRQSLLSKYHSNNYCRQSSTNRY